MNNNIKRVKRPVRGGVSHDTRPNVAQAFNPDVNPSVNPEDRKSGLTDNSEASPGSGQPIIENTPQSGGKKPLYIGIAAVVVVAIAVATFFLLKGPIEITKENNYYADPGFEMDYYTGRNDKIHAGIELFWPEGDEAISQSLRQWIRATLNQQNSDGPTEIIEEWLKDPVHEYSDLNVDLLPFENEFINASIYSQGKVSGVYDMAYFRISDGAKLPYDLLPDTPETLSVIKDAIKNSDSWDYNYSESLANIKDYKTLLKACKPYFSDEGLVYQHIFDTESLIPRLRFTIPYASLIGIASEELLKFVPEKYIKEFAEGNVELTTGLVEQLAKSIPTNSVPSREILSDEFAKICDLGEAMPGYLDGIGEEEVMCYWHGGQDPDPDYTVKNIDFVRSSNDEAIVNVDYMHWGSPHTAQIKFVKVSRAMPSGITTKTWVVDNFINMKSDILEATRSQYENLVSKSVEQRIQELEAEGSTLNDEMKEAYKSRVKKFMEMYREFM